MAGRGEISWKGRDAEGARREVLVRRHGDDWDFYERVRRFERWERVAEPSLDDWRTLLDAVKRRAGRRLCPPEEPRRVHELMRRRFPDAEG